MPRDDPQDEGGVAMTSHSRTIAGFVASLELEDVPQEVASRAKQLILESFGCAMFGTDLQWTEIMARTFRRMEPGGGNTTVWGRGETASPINAALLNGTMIQGYELDDGHPAASFHGTACILPAAIAAAEYVGEEKVSGRQLLAAIIAGLEVGPRVGLCMNGEKMTVRGWHAPGIISSFPAAMTAGKLLGLDPEHLDGALGLAGTQASGLMVSAMAKRMQCAKGGQSGLYAAMLAREGFPGIENIFEMEFGGYCTTFTGSTNEFDLAALTDGLGSRWETLRMGSKKYACRGGIHTALYAVEKLMKESGLKAADVAEIDIGLTEAQIKKSVWHPYVPNGMMAAQFHLGFCTALLLIEGNVFVDQMVEDNIGRADIIELANRIRGFRSLEREQRGHQFRKGADVTVRLRNGKTLQKTIEDRPGSQRLPLTSEESSAKYRQLAGKVLDDRQLAELEDTVNSLESATDLTRLLALLRTSRRSVANG